MSEVLIRQYDQCFMCYDFFLATERVLLSMMQGNAKFLKLLILKDDLTLKIFCAFKQREI